MIDNKIKTITTITHLRDIEVSILNYMMENKENSIEIANQIEEIFFTFETSRRVYSLIIKDIDDQINSLLNLKNLYPIVVRDIEGNDIFEDLSTQSADYIFNGVSSKNIDLDIFELKEYHHLKVNSYIGDYKDLTITIKDSGSENICFYNNNLLFNIKSKNIGIIQDEILMTFGDTLINVAKFTEVDNCECRVFFDEDKNINEITLTKDLDYFEKLESLYEWFLNHNILLPKNRFELSSESIFDFDNKKIKELPFEINLLEKAKTISLKDNQLNKLPIEMETLSLVFLALCNNEFKEIPEFIFDIKNLDTLCFHGNKLTEINKDIKKLKNLKILSISNNEISSLPIEILELKKLEQIDLENTLLDDIPLGLLEMETLNAISFDDRHLPFISKNIHLLKNVNTINLIHSDYKETDEIIQRLNLEFDYEENMDKEDKKDNGCIYLTFKE